MLDYILIVGLCLLCLYGGWSILRDISGWGMKASLIDREHSKLILLVRDKEESIEAILHTTMKNNSGCFDELTVIDMGSKDETYKILLKLSEKYGNLRILSIEEKDNIFCG